MVNFTQGPAAVVALLSVIAVIVILGIALMPATPVVCPKELRRNAHGELRLHPTKREFPDMNAFQNWWYASGLNKQCPLPVLVGPNEKVVLGGDGDYTEQTYAKTPINKVDDYEFSRVFGHQYGDEMRVDQDFNKILLARNTDWVERPITSDERRDKYRGLQEGFTAQGDMESDRSEALGRFNEVEIIEDSDCKISRQGRKVARLVEKAYESEKDWEPVVVQVGPNNWEVNELKPRHRAQITESGPDTVVDTSDPEVKTKYRYPDQEALDSATDPYYRSGGWTDPRDYKDGDPYRGVIPNMARMFGPTLDTQDWLNRDTL